MCIWNGVALLDFTDLVCIALPLSIWGNGQLFYKIGHLSTLVMFLVDSAERATAQKQLSPGRFSETACSLRPVGVWLLQEGQGRGLRGHPYPSLSPAGVPSRNGTTGSCFYFQTY